MVISLCLLLERCAGGCRDALSSGFVCGCCSLPARKRTQGCPSLGSVANTCDQQVALIVFRTQEPAWCGPELVPPHSCCLCHSLPGRRGRTIHPCLCDSTEPRRCNLRRCFPEKQQREFGSLKKPHPKYVLRSFNLTRCWLKEGSLVLCMWDCIHSPLSVFHRTSC